MRVAITTVTGSSATGAGATDPVAGSPTRTYGDLLDNGAEFPFDAPRDAGWVRLGAMDLVAGVKKVIVVMEHVAKDGGHKIVPECSLPLTGKNVVDMIVSDLAVFQRPDHGSRFRLIELAPGVTADEVAAKTTAAYDVAL